MTQIISEIDTVFNWDGKIRNEKEILLMIKIQIENESKVASYIKENHSYKVPEIISINSEILNEDYALWFFTDKNTNNI